MSILHTIAMFIYLFGYMILHYGILRRAERAAAAGDTAAVEQIYTGMPNASISTICNSGLEIFSAT